MRQLGVIQDKQAFSAAEVTQEEYFFCGPSPEMFLFIPNDLWNIPWFFAHCEIPNSLIGHLAELGPAVALELCGLVSQTNSSGVFWEHCGVVEHTLAS